MLYGEIGEHSWADVAFLAITTLFAMWNLWLTYRGIVLKSKQEENHAKIEQAKVESDERDDRTDGRVDLIQRSNLRRGAASAVDKKLAEAKGGDMLAIRVVSERVRAAFQPIVPILRELRKQFPDEVVFTEQVLKQYGKWIEQHICDVLGVHDYECMAMAVSVSEEASAIHKALQ